MATIILPFGYPIQSGTFTEIIYQGTIARQYTMPKDPRTDQAIFARKQFSDIAKLKSTLGIFSKGILRIVFGSKWSSTIQSMAIGNYQALYSSRAEEFNSFSVEDQNEIRSNTPYQATYNDPGRLWWSMYGMIYDLIAPNYTAWHSMTEPSPENASNMYEWWTADVNFAKTNLNLLTDNLFQQNSTIQSGSWSTINNGLASGGSYIQTNESGPSIEFLFYGRYLKIYFTTNTTAYGLIPSIDIINFYSLIFQQSDAVYHQQTYILGPLPTGIHHCKLQSNNLGNSSNLQTFDAVKIVKTKSLL